MADTAADAATASVDVKGDAAVEVNPAEGASDASGSESDAPSSPASGAGSGAGAGAGDSAEARAARSLSYKDAGNELFQRKKFEAAIIEYSMGIDCKPTAVLYANRAFAYLKTEAFGLAIADADKAVDLDPDYAKAYYRRGSANMALGRYKTALKDFKAVCLKKPKDKDARRKYANCKKQVKLQAFRDAIATEDAPSVVDTMDVDSMVVPSSYSGPRLPESGITLQFVLDLMETFQGQGKLHTKYCLMMLKQLKAYMREQPSLVQITVPETSESGERVVVNVCGDTHGQFYDLLNIFKLAGNPSPTNMFLFNGDFVDRGSFSVENVLVLFAWKLLYPDHFFLSRGNHETINMNKVYGFEGEVKHKFDMKVMSVFTEVFQALPLAHLINKKVFVVHGGLPANTATTMDDVAAIQRFREPPESGLMSDLLWSDPQPWKGVGISKRGVGVAFGPDITEGFCKTNGLDMVIRSHEVKEDGYLVEHEERCVTVFSAPNYCDQMGNKGAFVRLAHDVKPEFVTYTHVPHPPIKPMAYATSLGLFGL